MSRIRGGHNFVQIRFSQESLYSHWDELDLILALDQDSVEEHWERLKPDGILLIDEDLKCSAKGKKVLSLPLAKTASQAGNSKTLGVVALGAITKLFALDFSQTLAVIEESLAGKLLEANRTALELGYQLVEPLFSLAKPSKEERLFLNGSQALALGVLAAGCKFYSSYPMTPSTGIMNYLAEKMEEAEIVVEQAEDEIAAINMALGASYAGVRAMTGTSGGGFALMVEALGLAGMTETPLVIAEVQRPGPATGFPTRTEQGDLRFLISAAPGEFARMIIALRDPEDAFEQAWRAFNLAEKYQIPVFLLSDQYLADYSRTIPPLDFSQVIIERNLIQGEEDYKRYLLTEDGISPRALPGKSSGIVLADSDEHDEEGHITESALIRTRMVEKRLKRMEILREEVVEDPIQLGEENPEILLLGWGSTYGPLREAVEILGREGLAVAALVFGDIYPLPLKKVKELFPRAKKIINVEGNATGQLRSLLREAALLDVTHSLLKFDGRPFSSQEIYRRLKKEVL